MKKFNKKLLPAISAFMILIALGVFLTFNYNSNKTIQTATDDDSNIEYLHCSWNRNYTDLKDISESSDLVALVKVDSKLEEYVEDEIPFTKFSVNVIDCASDDSLIGENLTIIMTGTKNTRKQLEVMDDPLMNVNDQYLLFLSENNDGTYKILGGPAGRLVYDKDNQTVTSLCIENEVVHNENPDIGFKIEDKDLDSVMNKVENIINKSTDKDTTTEAAVVVNDESEN